MSNKKNDHGHDLEAAWIRELAAILEETGLTEVEIEKNSVRLRVSRQGGAAPMIAAAPAAAVAAAPGAATSSAPAAPANDQPGAVRSPMVGTAFLAASPGADPFVKVGVQVSEGQTVMIIEAMKTMNTIAAPKSGKVVKILVSDAQPVEFDDPLLIIE